MKPIRVLVAEDHALFRKGIVDLLRATEGFTVVGEARDGREAVAKAQALRPDIVLMDIYMPERDGIEATRWIRETTPQARIVILTISEEDQSLFGALKAGAHGYLLKSVEPEDLFGALRGVMGGEAFVTPSMATKLLAEFARQDRAARPTASAGLSPREREVLELLTRGAVNKEIAGALKISPNTVKNHLKNIMEKLHAENRVQVVARALREGLVKRSAPA